MRCVVLSMVLLLFAAARAHAADIVVVGDSQVGGFGRELRRLLVAEGHTVRVIHHNGWSAFNFRRQNRLEQQVQGADTVVVCLGGNNHRLQRMQYLRDLRWVVSALRAAGVEHILWLGPAYTSHTVIARRKQRTEELQRELLTCMGVTWVSSVGDTRRLEYRDDEVHLTRASYLVWAQHIFTHVTALLVRE